MKSDSELLIDFVKEHSHNQIGAYKRAVRDERWETVLKMLHEAWFKVPDKPRFEDPGYNLVSGILFCENNRWKLWTVG